MATLDHAKRELRAIGYKVNEGADKFAEVLKGEDDINDIMADDVLELLDVFCKQGHSGGSAGYAIDIFTKLAMQKPLGPLTGEDSEWVDVAEVSDGNPLWQNNRCSHVFKDNDLAWDIDARVFVDPDGCAYTSYDSRVTIEFPYTPTTVRFNVDADGKILDE